MNSSRETDCEETDLSAKTTSSALCTFAAVMKLVRPFCLLLMPLVPSCTQRHALQIPDATKTNQFILASRFGEFVSGIAIHITGELNGSALVILSGQATQEISGVVDWKKYEHLSASNCVLDYWPQHVTGGHLTVDYVFH